MLLYGCEAWSLTLWEERRLRLFENRILRRIFGPKRDANEEWRKLHNKELHIVYQLHNTIVRVIKSRRLRLAGHVARMEERRSAFKISASTPRGKMPIGRHRHRWADNIRMDLEEIGINTRNWVVLAQVRDYCIALRTRH